MSASQGSWAPKSPSVPAATSGSSSAGQFARSRLRYPRTVSADGSPDVVMRSILATAPAGRHRPKPPVALAPSDHGGATRGGPTTQGVEPGVKGEATVRYS